MRTGPEHRRRERRGVRGGRPRRVQRPGDPRHGRPRSGRPHRGPPVPQRPGHACPTGCTGTSSGCTPDVLTGLRDALRSDPDLLGARDRLLGRRLRPGRARRRAGRQPAALPRRPQRGRRRRRARSGSPAEQLYAINGLQFLPFNTLYQFAADPRDPRSPGVQALLIPDLLGYWLTGSGSPSRPTPPPPGCWTPAPGSWSAELLARARAARRPAAAGASRRDGLGALPPTVPDRLGSTGRSPLTTVGSHDTASAVVGVPARDRELRLHLLRHLGVWSASNSTTPVLTEASRAANFTNERGVDGTIRYLRNVMGLWLLSESLRTWQLQRPRPRPCPTCSAAAGALPAGGPTFDPDDPRSCHPATCPRRIAARCRDAGDARRATRPPSSAASWTASPSPSPRRIEQAERLSGNRRRDPPRRRRLAQRTALPTHRRRRRTPGRRRARRGHRDRQPPRPGPHPSACSPATAGTSARTSAAPSTPGPTRPPPAAEPRGPRLP